MRVAGVDPGTRSFDIVVIEENRVVAQRSIDTPELADKPDLLANTLDELSVDIIVAPSGYGIPLDRGDNIRDPRRLAIEVLLLSDQGDLHSYDERDRLGVGVYKALADTTVYLVNKYRGSTVFIPGVIHLPTIPWYRKINKVDMGTADKLAAVFLSVYEIAHRENLDYGNVNMVVSELGYGYNAAIAVKCGKIVDGIGGTVASIGTLTSGALDLEVVAGAKYWKRWDVAHGGIFEAANVFNIDELMRRAESGEEPYASLVKAYVEGIVKDIMREIAIVREVDFVVLTGRFSRSTSLRKLINEYLRDVEIATLKGLKGASNIKEAAQGYAAMGAGLFVDEFKDLLIHMEIDKSCGTAVDYVVHPRASSFVERVKKSYLESVYKPRLCVTG